MKRQKNPSQQTLILPSITYILSWDLVGFGGGFRGRHGNKNWVIITNIWLRIIRSLDYFWYFIIMIRTTFALQILFVLSPKYWIQPKHYQDGSYYSVTITITIQIIINFQINGDFIIIFDDVIIIIIIIIYMC